MQISPINIYSQNYNHLKVRQANNAAPICFQAAPQKFIPVNEKSFKTETAQRLFQKIKQYINMIGREGNVKEVTILKDNEGPDVLLTAKRTSKDMDVVLTEKFDDGKKFTIFDAKFNKDGQMTSGILPDESIQFERSNPNIRRIKYGENSYLPVGKNDKEWDSSGQRIKNIVPLSECPNDGAYEIFMELARLNTSILK